MTHGRRTLSQVLCTSWKRAAFTSLEQPMSPYAEKRKAMGAGDAAVFDYCNCKSQPADRDLIDALRLNPKV